jgi:hypothetical protein
MRGKVLLAGLALLVAGAFAADPGGGAPGPAPARDRPLPARSAAVGIEARLTRLEAEAPLGAPPPAQTDAGDAGRAVPAAAALAGQVFGLEVPAVGLACAVEAIRLTATRSAVTARRRGFLAPGTGRFALGAVEAGTWQLVLVEPRFAFGPLVEVCGPAELSVQIELRPGGSLLVHPPRPGRAELIAVRSPELRGAGVHLQVFVASHDFAGAEPWRIEGLPAGEYELLFPPTAGEPLRRAAVTVGSGEARLDLR